MTKTMLRLGLKGRGSSRHLTKASCRPLLCKGFGFHRRSISDILIAKTNDWNEVYIVLLNSIHHRKVDYGYIMVGY